MALNTPLIECIVAFYFSFIPCFYLTGHYHAMHNYNFFTIGVSLTAVRIDRRQNLTSRYFQVIYVANVCAVLVYM